MLDQEGRKRAKDVAAIGGRFRIVRHDVSGIKGSGPDGEVRFEDLWEMAKGRASQLRSKFRDRVKQDLVFHNKFTKRGLSFIMLVLLRGHNSVTDESLVEGSITTDTTSNPFQALFLMADKVGYPADAKVTWDESDLGNNAKIPPAPTLNVGTSHTLYEGRRGIDTDKTTDPGLKRITKSWVSTNPYGEMEMTFYSPSPIDSLVKATGDLDFSSVPDDGDYIILDDGINDPVRIEFDSDNSITVGVPGTDYATRCDITGSPSVDTMATRLAAVIQGIGDKLYISAAVDDVNLSQVNLTHEAGGSIGNQTIDISNATGHFTKNDMAGGTDPSMDDDQITNFPIKSVGFARDVNCGNGETHSKNGLRAIVGLAPTDQGKADILWVHEAANFIPATPTLTVLHHYIDDNGANRQTITSQSGVDGYVARSGPFPDPTPPTIGGEKADDVLATFGNGIAITAATNQFVLDEAEWLQLSTLGFDETHMRLVLRVTNSATGGNNKDYHIREIMGPKTVRTFESPAADDDDTTTPALQVQLVRTYQGANAFDGHLANEGKTEAPSNHSDPRGTVVNGEKWVSQNLAGPHVIGRVWGASSKQVKRIRIIAPPGVSREYLPDEFQIQYLDPTKVGSPPGDLRPGDETHWTDIPAGEGDYTSGGEAVDLYTAGQYGKEYVFTTATPACYGIRLKDIRSEDDTQRVELAQLMIGEEVGAPEGFPITFSNDRLKFSVDGGATDLYVDLPDVSSTSDMQDLVDAINQAVVGYGVEAVRSTFGFLWFRATVQGDNSTLRVYDYGKSGSLGLTSGGDVNRTGVTQFVRQLVKDALTIIYRFSMWGNRPQAV
jgi:hypothetical protein